MNGRGRRRRTMAFRLFTLLALAVGAALLLVACGEDHPYTTVSPRTPAAHDIQFLYKLIFWLALVVFVGVQFGIVYSSLRFRRRRANERGAQTHGNKRLEILWTIIPAIVLLAIFIPSVRTIYHFHDQAEYGDYQVQVFGKQWYWQVLYTKPDAVAGIETANEIHVPQGAHVQFELMSNNVIHSFWVPQLDGKMDVIPGHVNKLGFTADHVGSFEGECAEFCGDEHAWMRFRVIVDPPAKFEQWVKAYKMGPNPAAAQAAGIASVTQAPAAFSVCLGCHRVNGMTQTADGAPVGPVQYGMTSAETDGPNLTLLGCRATIGAGVLSNTPANLKKWLEDPGAVKPGNFMASVIKKGTLNEDQINTLVTYLEGQQFEGCQTP